MDSLRIFCLNILKIKVKNVFLFLIFKNQKKKDYWQTLIYHLFESQKNIHLYNVYMSFVFKFFFFLNKGTRNFLLPFFENIGKNFLKQKTKIRLSLLEFNFVFYF